MTERKTILRNRAKCLRCQDIIESTHVHDYVTCSCGAISVDGGKEYFKRSGNPEDYEDMSQTAWFNSGALGNKL